MNTSLPDPARFTHLTATLAGQVHQEIAPHVPLDQVTEWAMAALHRGVIQYRSRQGASLRTYLTYKILDGIYNALSETAWPSVHDENRYKFAKKSNELMMHFATSAEGAVKRSIRLEEEEMTHVLRLLVITGLIIYKDVPRGEIHTAWNLALANLNDQQKRFLTEYYDRDSTLEQAAQMTSAQAFRFQWKVLETLESAIKNTSH